MHRRWGTMLEAALVRHMPGALSLQTLLMPEELGQWLRGGLAHLARRGAQGKRQGFRPEQLAAKFSSRERVNRVVYGTLARDRGPPNACLQGGRP